MMYVRLFDVPCVLANYFTGPSVIEKLKGKKEPARYYVTRVAGASTLANTVSDSSRCSES